MKVFNEVDFKSFENKNGFIICPTGNYENFSDFPDKCVFDENCFFSDNTKFGDNCKFGNMCIFGDNCYFGDECNFGDKCSFGNECTFSSNNDIIKKLQLKESIFNKILDVLKDIKDITAEGLFNEECYEFNVFMENCIYEGKLNEFLQNNGYPLINLPKRDDIPTYSDYEEYSEPYEKWYNDKSGYDVTYDSIFNAKTMMEDYIEKQSLKTKEFFVKKKECNLSDLINNAKIKSNNLNKENTQKQNITISQER